MRTALSVFLLFSVSTSQNHATVSDGDFLQAFFQNKNALVTVSNCWTKRKNQQFLRSFATAPNFQQIGNFISDDINLVKTWSSQVYFVLDLRNCSRSLEILSQLNEASTFDYVTKYLVLVAFTEFSRFRDGISRFQILPNCEFVVAAFGDESVILFEPYKAGKINDLTWEDYGNWSLEAGLFEYYWDRPTSRRRINLKRANLLVGIVIFENETLQNMNYLTEYKFPETDTFIKQDYEPMLCTLQYLNVNYSFSIGNDYGYKNATTGNLTGLIAQLQSREVDVSGCSFYMSHDRLKAVDFLKQGNTHSIRFVIRKPSTSFAKNIFIITLTHGVWFASLTILAVFALAVILVLNWEVKHKKKAKQTKYSVSDVTLISLEAVCQQGTTTEPRSYSGRILALVLFGAFMFIYVSYSANIVVLLQSTTKIAEVRQLLESRIEVGGLQTSYMRNYFEAVKKGTLRKLYLQKIYPDNYYSLDVGMKKVLDGNFAFHVVLQAAYQYMLKYFTNHEICSMQELPGYIQKSVGYIAIQKQSPYKDLFKVTLLRIDEYGLQRRTNNRIIQVPRCFSTAGSFKSVGFYDCEQVLWIWIGGTLLAVLIIAAENAIHYCSVHIR